MKKNYDVNWNLPPPHVSYWALFLGSIQRRSLRNSSWYCEHCTAHDADLTVLGRLHKGSVCLVLSACVLCKRGWASPSSVLHKMRLPPGQILEKWPISRKSVSLVNQIRAYLPQVVIRLRRRVHRTVNAHREIRLIIKTPVKGSPDSPPGQGSQEVTLGESRYWFRVFSDNQMLATTKPLSCQAFRHMCVWAEWLRGGAKVTTFGPSDQSLESFRESSKKKSTTPRLGSPSIAPSDFYTSVKLHAAWHCSILHCDLSKFKFIPHILAYIWSTYIF